MVAILTDRQQLTINAGITRKYYRTNKNPS